LAFEDYALPNIFISAMTLFQKNFIHHQVIPNGKYPPTSFKHPPQHAQRPGPHKIPTIKLPTFHAV
jgi:hypothetical protein